MNRRFFLYYIFCVLCSSSIVLGMEIETEESNPTDLRSKELQLPVQVEKSFIFKTDETNTRLMLLKGSYNYKLRKITKDNEKPEEIASFASFKEGFQGIERYIPFAHKTDTGYYFYAVTKQRATFYPKDVYAVVKITIDCDLIDFPQPFVQTLYQHESPIMHLCMIKKNNKQYLASGSYYPSIKIYHLLEEEKLIAKHEFESEEEEEEKKTAYIPQKVKHIHTLHNRFLLGSTDNTLIYARKEDNERRKTALTRWLYSDINKTYNATICTLTNSFDTKDEKNKNIFIEINKDNYPLNVSTDKSFILLNEKDNYINIYPSDDQDIEPIYATPLTFKMEIGNKEKKIQSLQEFKKYLKKIFTGENFTNYIKLQITYEKYLSFLNESVENKDNKDNEEFFIWLIKGILSKIINHQEAVRVVAYQIVHEYGNALYRNNIAESHYKKINLKDPITYQKLRQYFTSNILHVIHEKVLAELWNKKDIQVYTPIFIHEEAKNICADNKSVFLQTDQQIWKLDLTSKKFDRIYQETTMNSSIENIFTLNNNLYLITKDAILKIDLSKEQKSVFID